MECYIGLDVSQRHTAICVIDAKGKIAVEGKALTLPSDIHGWLVAKDVQISSTRLRTASWHIPVRVIQCKHMNTDTFSVRVDRSTRSRLEKLAKSTGRSRSFLAAEAITAYLDTNEWQISGITAAISSLDRGKGIPHERVKQWVGSWETRKERPTPRSV